MKTAVAPAYATAEAAASVATSAFSKDCPEDVGILAIVVAELIRTQVQWQIGLADIVILGGADRLVPALHGCQRALSQIRQSDSIRVHGSIHGGDYGAPLTRNSTFTLQTSDF